MSLGHGRVNRGSHNVSTRNRNVPILSEIEMSPFERPIRPVGARGKPVLGVFQAAVGAFLASTAAAASTGSSWLGRAVQRGLAVGRPGVATPGMIRARPSGPVRAVDSGARLAAGGRF